LQDVIESTLNYQWKVEIAECEIYRRWGIWISSAAPFNPKVAASLLGEKIYDAQQPDFKTGQEGSMTVLKMAVEKLTRPGTLFSVDTQIQQVHDPSLAFTLPYTRYDQSTLNLRVTQPLLRRLIINKEATEETLSYLQFNEARYELIQTMAERVRDAILEYWEVFAAESVVRINTNAERILESLASATYRLVQGEHFAASEMNEQIAEIARTRRDIVGSQQQLYDAYLQLLYLMGETPCAYGEQTPQLILDSFPSPKENQELRTLDCLLQLASSYRGDLISLRLKIQEALLNLRLAKNDILPNLDVILGATFQNSTVFGSSEFFFSSYYLNDAEKIFSGELRLSFALWNDGPQGVCVQRKGELCQACSREKDLWAEISTDVASTYRDLAALAEEIHWANQAVQWYETALKDEILRLKEGYSSLFIVIDFENRLREVLLEQVNVQKLFAQNIARLLYLTGTLVMYDPCNNQIKIDPLRYDHLLCCDE
jgi:outer membrane protein TolC